MHHARWPRFPVAVAAAILIALCPREASGQTRCSVEQELFFLGVTGRFTIGNLTVTLTLPRSINEAYLPMVLLAGLAAPNNELPEEELMIRSGFETVRLRDGAALHIVHRKGERLSFSIATADGTDLCSWHPPVIFLKKEYPERYMRKSLSPPRRPTDKIPGHGEIITMHITGEPISVVFRHMYSDGRREFRLDGVPGRILVETPVLFFLRDPQPAAGVRTLESEGESDRLHFVDVEKRLLPGSEDRENLEITVHGWRPRAGEKWPSFLQIINLNPQAGKLACGILHKGREHDEQALVLMSPFLVRDGSVTLSCEVRLHQMKPASVEDFVLNFTDFSPGHGFLPLLHF